MKRKLIPETLPPVSPLGDATARDFAEQPFYFANPFDSRMNYNRYTARNDDVFSGDILERPYDNRAALAKLRIPTLVVAGEEDGFGGAPWVNDIADAIPGAQRHVLPNAGHVSHVDGAGQLFPIFKDFLRNLPRRF